MYVFMNLINFLFLHFWSVVKYFHKKEKKKKGKKGGKKIRQHRLTFDSLCFQKKKKWWIFHVFTFQQKKLQDEQRVDSH